jgi:hypothetical protein
MNLFRKKSELGYEAKISQVWMQESTSTKLHENCGRLSWVQRFWMLYFDCGVKYGENFIR